ncbi:MAG: Trp biosynthesis-associated membrane protein, partial [Microbacterium sp.]|nr:Trp biosynthesis-associated membrane protein [Microbacterium sp.]
MSGPQIPPRRPRARLSSVLLILLCGAIAVISSTQTWLTVALTGSAAHTLTVAGSVAVPVLTPLGLAVLALGAALSIVGTVLRYAFGILSVAIAVVVGSLTAVVAFTHPVSAVARTVTDATGITGNSAIAPLIASIS